MKKIIYFAIGLILIMAYTAHYEAVAFSGFVGFTLAHLAKEASDAGK